MYLIVIDLVTSSGENTDCRDFLPILKSNR